jgi:hypothetical protein
MQNRSFHPPLELNLPHITPGYNPKQLVHNIKSSEHLVHNTNNSEHLVPNIKNSNHFNKKSVDIFGPDLSLQFSVRLDMFKKDIDSLPRGTKEVLLALQAYGGQGFHCAHSDS